VTDPKASEHPQAPAKKEVFKIHIRGSLDDVWQELVRTEGLQRAMFNSRLETDGVRPGGQLRMRSPDGKYTAVAGRYIEVEERARLSHTFRFTAYDDPECAVVYDLRETGGGVDVTLTIENIPEGTKTAKQMRQGGTFIVNNLKAIVETGKPTFGARMLFVLFKLMAPLNPKQSRSVYWPIEPSVGEGGVAS